MVVVTKQPHLQQTVIVPTGKMQPWLHARLALDKKKKKMPSNANYDSVLIGSDAWMQIKEVFPAWTDTVLVYPESGGEFKGGEEVIDALKDGMGNSWVFSTDSIPMAAIGKKGVAICIDHPKIKLLENKVVLSAGTESTVTVLRNFIQESGRAGRVDERTRVPLESDTRDLPLDQIRRLYRVNGAGVRPLVRVCDGYIVDRWAVNVHYRQDYRYGVAQLETISEAAAQKIGIADPQLAAMVRKALLQI